MSKAPWFLRLLSYLVEIPVSKHSSRYSPELKVSLFRGRYMLSVNRVVYSFEDEYTSFKKAFQRLQPTPEQVKNLLVLGYGLGSVPAILYKRHGLKPHITAVDIDPVILQLAQTYSPLPKDVEVDYMASDAVEFLGTNTRKFDLIAIDLFIDDQVPLAFHTPEFLRSVTTHLEPGGMLLFNWLYADEAMQHNTDNYYQQVFQKTLPGAFRIDTGGNMVLGWRNTWSINLPTFELFNL